MAAQLDEIKQKVKTFYDSASKFLPIKRVLLYGSWARGCPGKDSDIDVAVVVEAEDHSQRLKIGTQLFHFAVPVDVRIEPKCVFWDEYLHPEPASILSEIIRTGIEIV